jgi:hypothetical protein
MRRTPLSASPKLNWNLADPQSFLRQAQLSNMGFRQTIEFAAILRWLGGCYFVHRLNEEVLKDPAHDTMEVPDLLAVFSDDGDTRAALIEVKTGDELSLVFSSRRLCPRLCPRNGMAETRLRDINGLDSKQPVHSSKGRAIGGLAKVREELGAHASSPEKIGFETARWRLRAKSAG